MPGEEYDEEEEEYDDEQWAEYEAQQAAWKSQEDEKENSSKDSSYIFIDSAKTSPKEKSSSTKGKVAAGTSPKPKEAEKDLRFDKRRSYIEDFSDALGESKTDVGNGHWKHYQRNYDRRREA